MSFLFLLCSSNYRFAFHFFVTNRFCNEDNTLGSWLSICSPPSDIGDFGSWFSICSPPSDIGDNTLGSWLSICSPPSDIGLVYVLLPQI